VGCLGIADREEILVGLRAGESLNAIGRQLGRSVSTVSREVARTVIATTVEKTSLK
jgi:IS30 family transposase